MKRMGHLYDVVNEDFVRKQLWNATAHKEKRPEVQWVMKHADQCTKEVLNMLLTLDFEFAPPRPKQKYDPHSKKTRDLLIHDFYPWQIICWCYVQMMKPLFMKGMYRHSYGSIPGRGMVAAGYQVRKWLDEDYEHTRFGGEFDIRKFYQSVDQEVLMQALDSKCKDPRAMKLSDMLIHNIPSGLPMGNYPSPWLGNFYLQPLDHLIKEQCRTPHLIRYMDNFNMLSDSKQQLHDTIHKAEDFANDKLHLQFGSSTQVYPTEPRGIDFLGHVYHTDYTALRGRNFLSLTRQSRELIKRIDAGEEISLHEALGCGCRIAFARRGNSWRILRKYCNWPYEVELRKIVRKGMRKKHLKEVKHNEHLSVHQQAGWQQGGSDDPSGGPDLPWDPD